MHILRSVSFLRKSHRLWDNVEKCDGARVAAGNMAMLLACWISKATRAKVHARDRACTPTPIYMHARTHTHLLLFHSKSALVNAPQRYVLRTLPALGTTCTFTSCFGKHYCLAPVLRCAELCAQKDWRNFEQQLTFSYIIYPEFTFFSPCCDITTYTRVTHSAI